MVPEKVRAVGNQVYALADELKSALNSAANDVDSVLDDGWTGSAAIEFFAGWTDVSDGGKVIMQALTEMAEKLGVTADTYTAQDQGAAANLNNSSLDLP